MFDRLGRDDRGWVISVAHLAVVRADQLADRHPEGTRLAPVNAPGRLAHDHNEITMAVADPGARYTDKPDPDHLLGDRFTLRQLRQVHQAVAGEPIGPDKIDTFRRKMKLHPDRNPGLRHRRQPRPPRPTVPTSRQLTTSPAVVFAGRL